MKKTRPISSTPITVSILRLSHDGRGIAKHNGKTVFVFNALPGETVRVQLTRQHTQFDEARVLEIITPAPERQVPLCPHFNQCGGCSLQHISQAQSVDHKSKTVTEVLARQAQLSAQQLRPTLCGPAYGYRRKARLAVTLNRNTQQLQLGFRRKNSRAVTAISRCEILDPWFGHRLEELTQHLNQLEEKQFITELTLIADHEQRAIIVHHRHRFNEHDLGVLQTVAKVFAAQLGFDPENWHSLQLSYAVMTPPLTLNYTPAQFIQVNAEVNAQLISAALTLLELTPDDTVLELFCGVGNFSLPIATQAKTVVGVEGDAAATAMASLNAQKNRLSNATFQVQDLFSSNYQGVWSQQRYAKLILDPPRAGAKEIMPFLAIWQPSLIVYVSCNPFTFARDAKLLQAQGYELDVLQVADMFPQTEHCELIAQFQHRRK